MKMQCKENLLLERLAKDNLTSDRTEIVESKLKLRSAWLQVTCQVFVLTHNLLLTHHNVTFILCKITQLLPLYLRKTLPLFSP